MKKWNHSIYLWTFLIMLLTGCTGSPKTTENTVPNSINSTQNEARLNEQESSISKDTTPNNLLNAYFIDVGQGDACLLEQNGHFMLIDAGDNIAEQTIVNFLKEKKVDELDYVVATHPHADHIGGLDAVLDAFSVDEIYMPKIVADTKTFEDVLDSVERQHLQVNTPVVGTDFQFADTNVEILAPIQNYEDLNNHSVVLRMTCQDTTFLFTGDMETESEMDVLSSGHEISADILKVGHHGSETSTSQAFLDAVNPKIAIISVGADNSYGHPTETVLNRLAENDIQLYRTDKNGTIHVISDGNAVQIECNSDNNTESNKTQQSVEENPYENIYYIGNKNTKKFHLPDCPTLPAEKNRVEFDTKEDAISDGYIPCKNCLES